MRFVTPHYKENAHKDQKKDASIHFFNASYTFLHCLQHMGYNTPDDKFIVFCYL